MQDYDYDSGPGPARGLLGSLVIYALIVVLLVATMLLPPISAAERILSFGYADIPAEEGGFVTAEDGAQLIILPEGVEHKTKLKFTAISRSSFLEGTSGSDLLPAAENIPLWLIMKSPYYQIQSRGRKPPTQVVLRIPIPVDAEPNYSLDLYSWNGQAWEWLPHFIPPGDNFIESQLDFLPRSAVVVQTKPLEPSVSVDLPESADLPEQARNALDEIDPQGLYLDAGGTIRGDPGALPQPDQTAGYLVVPTLRNWEDNSAVRSDLVDNMLGDPSVRQEHVQRIVELVIGQNYPAIDIDYQGISPDLRGEYTAFISELADALHAQGKQLAVRLELPGQIAADQWETGAYDWRAIGAVADAVRIPVPSNPAAYAPAGQMEAMLQWAVGEVNRYKLQLLFSTRSTELTTDEQKSIPYADALAPFSQVAVEGGSTNVNPGQQVAFTLTGPQQSTGIQFDSISGLYTVSYLGAEGVQHTRWVENAASVARKLGYVADYNLRGAAVQNLLGEENDSQIWGVLGKFQNLVIPPVESQLAVVWQVKNPSDAVVDQISAELNAPRHMWSAAVEGGEYTVTVAISSDGGATAAGRGSAWVVVAP
jgi:spore germination protein YaaH